MRVLVTGSSGLVGRWVCDYLSRNDLLTLGLDTRTKPSSSGQWNSVQCDLLDESDLITVLERFRPTHVVHLAARTDLRGRDLDDYSANTTGVKNLINAIKATSSVKRAIYTSSQLVCKVGHTPKSDIDYCPTTVYGQSKVETERLVRNLNEDGLTWCIARPTTVWGPHMSPHYTSLLRYIENGRYFHSGGGALLKSYSYAGNIAFQYWKLLTARHADIHKKVFYMADYEPLSLRDYVNELADEMHVARPRTMPLPAAKLLGRIGDLMQLMGVAFPYNSFRLRNIRTEYIFDMKRTRDVCGPLPYDFKTGITDTVEWYRSIGRKGGK